MNSALPTLDIHYDFSPRLVLDDPDIGHKVRRMRACGVSTIWLDCYLYGHWEATREEILQLKHYFEGNGFRVEVLSIPLGHADQTARITDIGEGWTPRVDASGHPIPNTSCARNPKLLADSRAAAETCLDMGFTKIFYDDDLRLGAWGPSVQGCFCDTCMNGFRTAYPAYRDISRPELATRIGAGDRSLTDAWETFQCESILQFLKYTTPAGLTPGIMVMHNGDRRHGVDIARIRREIPDINVRVGEGHFADPNFLDPQAHDSIAASIRRHLSLIGSVEHAFSEATTAPVGALSPQNLVEKIRIEIDNGIRNIYLMSGSQFLTDDYWDALASALPELKKRAADTPLPNPDAPLPEFIWQI